jgi:hypothetical protein
MTKETLLAATPLPMNMLSYQPVFSFGNGQKYLKSVNILYGNSILKKIYLQKQLPLTERSDISEIVGKILVDHFKTEAANRTKSSKNEKPYSPNQNREARAAAAKDLFENLNA